MVTVVRQSKYRHVFGEELQEKFEDVKSAALVCEGTLIVSNGKHVAFCWDTAGPGILYVLSLKHELGRVPPGHPWIRGHTGIITDFEFNPFNDNEIVTGCEDSNIRLFRVPDNGITEDIHQPITTLQGHGKKISLLKVHPAAAYILASAGQEKAIKIWSVEKGISPLTYSGIPEVVQGLQ